MIEVLNLGEVFIETDAWLARATFLAEEALRGYGVETFKKILLKSPQYSGDFTSNWRFSVDEPDTTWEPRSLEGGPRGIVDPFIMEDPEAIALAIARNTGNEMMFKLGQTIYISNSATHDEPYAFMIEEGTIKFRDGNAGHSIAYSVAEMMAKHQDIGTSEALSLAAERI